MTDFTIHTVKVMLNFKLIFVFVIFAQYGVYVHGQGTTGCPIDFVKYAESCYHIFDTPTLKWWEAMAFCNVYGSGEGSLATIETEGEQLFLESQLNAKFPTPTGKDYWLGANDIVNDGTWVWIRKNEYVQGYTRWAPGEPSSHASENCLGLYDGLHYQWNDAPCSLPEGFICEVPFMEQDIVG